MLGVRYDFRRLSLAALAVAGLMPTFGAAAERHAGVDEGVGTVGTAMETAVPYYGEAPRPPRLKTIYKDADTEVVWQKSNGGPTRVVTYDASDCNRPSDHTGGWSCAGGYVGDFPPRDRVIITSPSEPTLATPANPEGMSTHKATATTTQVMSATMQ